LSNIPTIAPFLLPRVLPALARACPRLEIQLHEEVTHQGCEALARGGRDCMLLALPYPTDGLEHAALFDDPIVVALRQDEPLAFRSEISPADLPAERMLLLDEGHCLRDQALSACERPDLDRRSMHGASIHTLVQLIDAGMGISLIPGMAMEAGVAERTAVAARPLAAPEARRTIALAWRRGSPRAEEFALLADKIRGIWNPEHVSKPVAGLYDLCGLGAAETPEEPALAL
ncbi:MAG: LysR substrate-binding domain-containing protein, partial [Caulobacter sp.]